MEEVELVAMVVSMVSFSVFMAYVCGCLIKANRMDTIYKVILEHEICIEQLEQRIEKLEGESE